MLESRSSQTVVTTQEIVCDAQMDLAIVILNWNGAADTCRCLGDISGWKRLRPAIWVVDNGSSDDSADVIAAKWPGVHLIRNKTNLGFAGGNNCAIRQALAVSDAPILLLNNDAFIEEEHVLRMLETLQADVQIGFVGTLLLDADHPERLLAVGGKNPVWHHHTHIQKAASGGPICTVEYVPGTVILVRPEVFRVVGLLDEGYFFSTEIADLCWQAGRKGYRSVVDTRARALHSLGRSSDLRDTLHVYYIIRNRFLFIRKFYRHRRVLLDSFWTLYSLALALKLALSGKLATSRAVRLGLQDGLRGRFGGQNERVLAACSGLYHFPV